MAVGKRAELEGRCRRWWLRWSRRGGGRRLKAMGCCVDRGKRGRGDCGKEEGRRSKCSRTSSSVCCECVLYSLEGQRKGKRRGLSLPPPPPRLSSPSHCLVWKCSPPPSSYGPGERGCCFPPRMGQPERSERAVVFSSPECVCRCPPREPPPLVAVSRDQNAPLLLVVADAGFRNEIRSVLSGISLGDRSCFWLAKVLLLWL